jgi:hypothetical protein
MLEKTGVEALVLDPIQFFVELAAMKLRIPYVTVATALYLDFSGYTPHGISIGRTRRRRKHSPEI